MPVTITIDDVPEEVNRRLESRARARGQSLEDYLLGELELVVAQTLLEARMQDGHARGPLDSDVPGGTADSASA